MFSYQCTILDLNNTSPVLRHSFCYTSWEWKTGIKKARVFILYDAVKFRNSQSYGCALQKNTG